MTRTRLRKIIARADRLRLATAWRCVSCAFAGTMDGASQHAKATGHRCEAGKHWTGGSQ